MTVIKRISIDLSQLSTLNSTLVLLKVTLLSRSLLFSVNISFSILGFVHRLERKQK